MRFLKFYFKYYTHAFLPFFSRRIFTWGRNKIIKRLKLFAHKDDLWDAIHDTCRLYAIFRIQKKFTHMRGKKNTFLLWSERSKRSIFLANFIDERVIKWIASRKEEKDLNMRSLCGAWHLRIFYSLLYLFRAHFSFNFTVLVCWCLRCCIELVISIYHWAICYFYRLWWGIKKSSKFEQEVNIFR